MVFFSYTLKPRRPQHIREARDQSRNDKIEKIGPKTTQNISSKSVTKVVANVNKIHLPERNVLLK